MGRSRRDVSIDAPLGVFSLAVVDKIKLKIRPRRCVTLRAIIVVALIAYYRLGMKVA